MAGNSKPTDRCQRRDTRSAVLLVLKATRELHRTAKENRKTLKAIHGLLMADRVVPTVYGETSPMDSALVDQQERQLRELTGI